MENYKENIVATRKGGLGSSDATMVLQVAKSNELNDAAKLRIAVMLGLTEKPEFNKSRAMIMGDEIEMKLFADYKQMFPEAISNPLYMSAAMSGQYGFNVLNHIDIETIVEDEDGTRTLVWFECKASKLDTADVMNTYSGQFAWHWLLLREKAHELGVNAQMFLLHYPTNGMLNSDAYRLENVRQIEIEEDSVKVDRGMLVEGLSIIANAIPTFEWKQPEEIAAYNLPTDVQEALVALKRKMDEIKEAEKVVADFKEGITEQMEKLYNERGIKSIKCDTFAITYVAPSVSQNFDSKALKADDPTTYAKYLKESKRKGYVAIK